MAHSMWQVQFTGKEVKKNCNKFDHNDTLAITSNIYYTTDQ